MIGLKRGIVKLYPHEEAWEIEGEHTVRTLRRIFGEAAVDVQHVGSTAVKTIVAKPIIDIAVGVRSIDEARTLIPKLEEAGFFHRPAASHGEDHLFFSCVGEEADVRTHHIHVVPYGETEWIGYVALREYLKNEPGAAADYERCKTEQLERYSGDRTLYTENKAPTLKYLTRKAVVAYYLGKTVHIEIDRPIGYFHEKKPEPILYPINYGYVPKVLGGDDEELDVYLLGVNEPVSEYDCRIIGIVHRRDDVEDKLVGVPEGMVFNQAEIAEAVDFQEKYHSSFVEPYYHKSVGAVIYRLCEGIPEYLVVYEIHSNAWSIPKGHMEACESELDAAQREILEECGILPTIDTDFREELHYPVHPIGEKTVVLFIAEYNGEITAQKGEIEKYRWVRTDEAKALLKGADHVIDRAEEYIRGNNDAEHLR